MNRQKEIDLEQGITSYTNIILSTVESCLWSRDLILSLKTLIVDPSNPWLSAGSDYQCTAFTIFLLLILISKRLFIRMFIFIDSYSNSISCKDIYWQNIQQAATSVTTNLKLIYLKHLLNNKASFEYYIWVKIKYCKSLHQRKLYSDSLLY